MHTNSYVYVLYSCDISWCDTTLSRDLFFNCYKFLVCGAILLYLLVTKHDANAISPSYTADRNTKLLNYAACQQLQCYRSPMPIWRNHRRKAVRRDKAHDRRLIPSWRANCFSRIPDEYRRCAYWKQKCWWNKLTWKQKPVWCEICRYADFNVKTVKSP